MKDVATAESAAARDEHGVADEDVALVSAQTESGAVKEDAAVPAERGAAKDDAARDDARARKRRKRGGKR